MKAVLDISKNGDYVVSLTSEDIFHLYEFKTIQGVLTIIKNTTETCVISIALKSNRKVRELKAKLLASKTYFCEGPHVMIERTDWRHHIVTYIEEDLDDLQEKLQDDMYDYQENRYDSFTKNKIFLYRKM